MTLLPDFQLPTTGGGTAGTTEVSQHQELILAALHPRMCGECAAFLAALGERQGDWTRLHTAVRILPIGRGTMDTQLCCLIDAHGEAVRTVASALKVNADQPFVAVSDRYTRVYSVKPVHGLDPAQLVKDLGEWVDFIQRQCPECGAPVW